MKASDLNQISYMLQKYMTEADRTIDTFMDTMTAFLKGEDYEVLEKFANEVRLSEAACDKHRRNIESFLYTSSLTPDLRRDWHILVDLLDKVPNKIEHVSNFISLTGPQVPITLHGDIKEVLMMTLKCTSYLFEAVDMLFQDHEKSLLLANRVEYMENAVDKLERHMIRMIFKSDDDMGSKMLYHKLIEMICSISDRAEDASDRVKILSIRKDVWTKYSISNFMRRDIVV